MYADDTTLQMSSSNIKQLYTRANTELIRISDWFKANKLTLNAGKTKHILFRDKKKVIDFEGLNLEIENNKIDRIGYGCKEESFKFVGMNLDEHLNWSNHTQSIRRRTENSTPNFAKYFT